MTANCRTPSCNSILRHQTEDAINVITNEWQQQSKIEKLFFLTFSFSFLKFIQTWHFSRLCCWRTFAFCETNMQKWVRWLTPLWGASYIRCTQIYGNEIMYFGKMSENVTSYIQYIYWDAASESDIIDSTISNDVARLLCPLCEEFLMKIMKSNWHNSHVE